MNCMKCGRETTAEQVFCEDCRLEMEKYPVKPGTVVLLPNRREAVAPKKTQRRRGPSLEDQVKALKKRVKLLTILLAMCAVLIAAMAYPTVLYFSEDHFKVGQNYTTVVSTTEPTEIAEITAD